MLRVAVRGSRGLVAAVVASLLVSVLPLGGGLREAQQASAVLAFASGASLADVGNRGVVGGFRRRGRGGAGRRRRPL